MAKNSKITEIHPDLRATLEQGENLEQVHFTKTGAHYFNVHEYVEQGGKKTGRLFGFLHTKVVEVATKDSRGNTKSTLKLVTVPNPKAEIVETLTREEVLALPDMELEEITGSVADPRFANQKKPGKNKLASAEKAE